MTNRSPGTPAIGLHQRIDNLARSRPDIVLIGPFLVYLALLGLTALATPIWQPAMIALRGAGAIAVVWIFRKHLPPWGKPHWAIAIIAGLLVAWGWIAGQYLCNSIGLPIRLPIYPGSVDPTYDPRDTFGATNLFHTWWVLRLTVATTAVPIVEELFWRAFLLRALIDWHQFERVQLGTFTWVSFLGTSALSMFQHPDNWVVSVLCWMAFNAIFYWTRSILCLVLVHGITNLVLYLMTLAINDFSFI